MLIQQIARTTKLDVQDLRHLAASADRRYKVYLIPKRGHGHRKIEHPSREIKALQRWITKVIIDRFPVHHAATAYRKGSGVRENAERHRTSRYTNRYDFANFFPSFGQTQVENFVKQEAEKLGMPFDDDDLRFVGNIVCRFGRLSIGAPSSPALTNAMMFDFDRALFDWCQSKGLIYSRYADDLFISANEPDRLKKLEPLIAKAKRDVAHLTLRLNRRKTTYLSKKYARRVTGVIITSDHKLSIGRERKREIKALVHRWLNGKLDAGEIYYMRGLLAFARDIEPEFEKNLRSKYGDGVIDEVLRHPNLEVAPDPEFQPIPWL
ncbi:retron St85 family RNA-directed DNA polymerase [Cognatishimia activa]|uniref:retron St85 family RNA-directed DNA polymerase n=1 Tax=Cognatishimia activa TaxID=1715691 RepID=UPI00222FAD9C|nr:retron St85 family RNA-directed DNA polymerase [Cognatishimia activa]UZD90320.1 retron St85 family RNA-directed DNA polymerase [Cognatishimia activa]